MTATARFNELEEMKLAALVALRENDPGCTGGQKICWWQSCAACRFHRGVPVVERAADPCGERYNPDVPDCELPF